MEKNNKTEIKRHVPVVKVEEKKKVNRSVDNQYAKPAIPPISKKAVKQTSP